MKIDMKCEFKSPSEIKQTREGEDLLYLFFYLARFRFLQMFRLLTNPWSRPVTKVLPFEKNMGIKDTTEVEGENVYHGIDCRSGINSIPI